MDTRHTRRSQPQPSEEADIHALPEEDIDEPRETRGSTQPHSRLPTAEPPRPRTPVDLAQAMADIADILRSQRQAPPAQDQIQTKLPEPETYDGKDTRKLKKFLIICHMHFTARPVAFRDDITKMVYAISHLDGPPFQHFSPILSQDNASEVYRDVNAWDMFEDTLKAMFGPYDDSGDAEQELEAVFMRDNARISDYAVKFGAIVERLPEGWGEAAIRSAFYKGLPERLKDDLSRSPSGKPKTYFCMHELAMQYDARYWERHNEVSKKEATKRAIVKSMDKTPSTSQSANQASPSKKDEKKPYKPNTSNQGSKPNQPSASSSSAQPKSNLDSKLDKDGKVTSKEREYRILNNLCLYCGAKGHKVMNCEIRAKNSKARTAATSVNSTASTSGVKESKSASESKKD